MPSQSRNPRGPSRYNIEQSCSRFQKELYALVKDSPATVPAKEAMFDAIMHVLRGITMLYPVKKEEVFAENFRAQWIKAREGHDYDHDSWDRVARELGLSDMADELPVRGV